MNYEAPTPEGLILPFSIWGRKITSKNKLLV